ERQPGGAPSPARGLRLAPALHRIFSARSIQRSAMSANIWPIRSAATAAILGLALASTTASAADKVTFLTSWFAQAEHGGFYQAKATGLYEKAGLDVTLKMGGPQVNAAQLLLAGETDFMMGYDLQVLKMLEQGLPVITVATSFQFDLQGIMAHDHVAG